MTGVPITFTWTDDGVMRPLHHLAKECDRRFVVGEQYRLEEVEERSKASHDQQFAWVADAWATLPERHKFEPWAQSPTHLRRYALIRTGFCTTEQFPCASRAEAMRWAARLRSDDEYCLIHVDGSVVNRFRAESQKTRGTDAMKPRRFQESKQAIFDFIANEILNVDADAFARETGFKRQRRESPSIAPHAHQQERERVG